MVLEITDMKTNSATKMVAYADDFSTAGSISSLKYWWNTLYKWGPKFCYFPEPTKSWFIVESNYSDKKSIHLKIPTFKHRVKDVLVQLMEKLNKWVEELHVLSRIAKREP